MIYYLRFTIFPFLPRSPREVACPLGGKAVISQDKSAKSVNSYLKKQSQC